MPRQEEEPERNPLAKYLRYSYVGLQLFLSVGIFTGLGIWLDLDIFERKTLPLFTLLGLALGSTGGFYSLYRELMGQPPEGPKGLDRKKKGGG